jgi:hypothetical protein
MAKEAPWNSGSRRRSEREGERSKARRIGRSSSSSVQHPKRVTFKAEDEVIFSELTNNIINLAADSMNNFSSSLFDLYEIKALSKYVLSHNPPVSYNGDDGVSKKGWKEFGFSYDECLPGGGMRGFRSGSRARKRRFLHVWFPMKK